MASATIIDVLANFGRAEQKADREFDDFEKLLGPDKDWSEQAFNIVFNVNSKMTHRQKLAALRGLKK